LVNSSAILRQASPDMSANRDRRLNGEAITLFPPPMAKGQLSLLQAQ
jgi:hypothetical protein